LMISLGLNMSTNSLDAKRINNERTMGRKISS